MPERPRRKLILALSSSYLATLLVVGTVAWLTGRDLPMALVWGLSAAALAGLIAIWQTGRDLSGLVGRLREELTQSTENLASVEADRRLGRMILGALDTGIVLLDGNKVLYVNRAASHAIGERLTVLGDFHPPKLRDMVQEVGRSQETASVEFEQGLPPRRLIATAGPLGASAAILVTLADVTEARRVDDVRRDFVAAASHELKTPAAAIQAAAETIIEALRDDPEATRHFAQRVLDNAIRLSRVVSDLLDLSRLETQEPERQPVVLGEVVVEEMQRVGERGRKVVFEAEELVVEGDRADLGLAVRNLLDNAVRFTSHGDHVWIRVRPRNGMAAIEVQDEGPGIPRSDLSRVFERFYRVDAARSRATGGTGLGLAIVKHVAEQHGGAVEAESVLGEGSTFRILLPIA